MVKLCFFFYPKKCLELVPNLYINERDKSGNSVLCYYIRTYRGSRTKMSRQVFLDNVQALVDRGIQLDIQDENGKNAVHEAAFLNNKELISILKQGKNFYTALNQVCKHPFGTSLDILNYLEKNPDQKIRFNINTNESIIIKDQLLKLGAITEENIKLKQNPLHVAAKAGEVDIFKELISNQNHEKFKNKKNVFGKTPLDYAIQSGNEAIITMLKIRGAKTGIEVIHEKRKKDLVFWLPKVGIAIGVIGILTSLYQSNKQYGWLESLKQYLRSKKQ